jgi:hypothetical protein
MLNPVVLIGEPLDFKGKLKIYPPRVKDVVTNPNFGIFYKLLTISQDDIRDELKDKISNTEKFPTPFEYLLANRQYTKGFSMLLRGAF